MRVLITGAYGLIGSAVLARLHRDGHVLIGAGRGIAEAVLRFPYAQWISADFTRLTTAEAWLPRLAGIDAVVNCVGVLQDSARDDVARVQVDGTVALFDACVRAGIRRVIHVSAIGAAADAPTAFTRTKGQADAHLAGLDLDWVILRPAIVLAPAAYGGSAMLRGLAALPFATLAIPSRVHVVSIDDVAETVARCLEPNASTRVTWELAHPDAHVLSDIVGALRRWHGFRPQPRVPLPLAALSVGAVFAGAIGRLGWRSPAGRTALTQLKTGMTADPAAWMSATGIRPRSLDTILAERPANVQDRWFARLYLLKPIAIVSLAAFWVATGLIALGPGREAGIDHLLAAGLGRRTAEIVTLAGSLLDIALGLAVCVRRFAKPALQLMLLVSLAYLLVGTVVAPQLWLDPLGPYVKIVPVMLASLFTLAILDER